jgi:lipid-A-disaccharide synthase
VTDALLVSAGEASADRICAEILRAIGGAVSPFGMGGDGSKLAGLDQVVSMSDLNIMGFSAAFSKLPTVARISNSLLNEALARNAKVALLVGTSEFNQRLGKKLRRVGLRVLFCVPPQVWAWRSSRLKSLKPSVDRLAVIFPFEQALWQSHGYDATYVGHPSLGAAAAISTSTPCGRIAVLVGSRDQEARAHGPGFAQAAQLWCDSVASRTADLLISPSLSAQVRHDLLRLCDVHNLGHRDVGFDGACSLLGSYDAALCVSGTATLECALRACPPIIVYRASWLAVRLAKLLLTTPSIGLPNILLGESLFPEVLAPSLSPSLLAAHVDHVLLNRQLMLKACVRVRNLLVEALAPPEWEALSFGSRVAKLLEPLF